MLTDPSELDLGAVDLNLLIAFSAIYRAGSVKEAAERLHLTPSAVSMALGRLRSWFDDPLFVRGRRGMEPTPHARTLFEALSPALLAIRDSVLRARDFDPMRAELVARIGISNELRPLIVPALLDRLRRDAPGVRLVVLHASLRSVPELLDSGEASLLVLSGAPELERRFALERMYDESFCALYDARALEPRGKLTLKRYLSAAHVIVSSVGELGGRIDDALAERGLKRTVVLSVSDYALLPQILKGRPLLAEAPHRTARELAARWQLTAARLPFELPAFGVSIACHRRNLGDPAIDWLRARLRELLV